MGQAAVRVEREEARIEAGVANGPWLVVITKANREKEARSRLMAQGFEVYMPLRLLDPVTARRRGVTAAPLFPRILFARATMDAYRWQAIFNTIGVQRVLCDPASPRGVRPQFVERLMREEIDGMIGFGLRDPSSLLPPKPVSKDHRKWQKLDDVVRGLMQEGVDAQRKSLFLSLLDEGRSALTQDLRRT